MALTNLTEDGKYKSYEEQACSLEITGGIHNQLIFLLVIDSFLSITAILGNTLILVALHKESSLHAPSKLLLRTLAITDLCVGIIPAPLTVIFWMSATNKQWNICRYTRTAAYVTGYVLCSVSLLTLTAISVDRLLALLLGIRYRQVVNVKRIYATLTAFWILPIIFISMYFVNYQIMSWYGRILISLCLGTSVCSYIRIFFLLRYNRTRVQNHVRQGQRSQTVPLNIERYRKTVFSALWVQLALVFCYLPYGILLDLHTLKMLTASVFLAREFTVTLVYLNSSLNVVLYCWKIREVREAVKDLLRLHCCS